MSGMVKRRERIARVRRVEHVRAAGVALAAEAQLESLEESAARVLDLRLTLTAGVGNLGAGILAAKGELAHRLDIARFSLDDAITEARDAVELRHAERIEARIRQESADRLRERAVAAAADQAERRASANIYARVRRGLDEAA